MALCCCEMDTDFLDVCCCGGKRKCSYRSPDAGKKWALLKSLCEAAMLFLHFCVQQRRESGHADVGSDGDLDVRECKVQWERRTASGGGKGRTLRPSPCCPALLHVTHSHWKTVKNTQLLKIKMWLLALNSNYMHFMTVILYYYQRIEVQNRNLVSGSSLDENVLLPWGERTD